MVEMLNNNIDEIKKDAKKVIDDISNENSIIKNNKKLYLYKYDGECKPVYLTKKQIRKKECE